MSGWALDQMFRVPVEWGARTASCSMGGHRRRAGHPIDLPHFMAKKRRQVFVVGANQSLTQHLPEEVLPHALLVGRADGSRVLTWISLEGKLHRSLHAVWHRSGDGAAFLTLRNSPLHGSTEIMRRGIRDMMESYRKANYPYDAVLALHAFDNWGSEPSQRLTEAAKDWNKIGESPKLVISSPREFFKHIEEKYGKELPMRRGGFGGQWEGVRNGRPRRWPARAAAKSKLSEMARSTRSGRDENPCLRIGITTLIGKPVARHDDAARKPFNMTGNYMNRPRIGRLKKANYPPATPIELPSEGVITRLRSNFLYRTNWFFDGLTWTRSMDKHALAVSRGAEAR